MEKNKETKGTFIEIDKRLIKEIKSYTELNKLQLTAFINELLQKAFMVEKYGDMPAFMKKQTVPVEKEPETIIEEPVIEEVKIEETPVKQIKGKKIITY